MSHSTYDEIRPFAVIYLRWTSFPGGYWIPWPELLRRTIGVDPELCVCGAKMTVDDAITEPEKITETLARLGIDSTGPPKTRWSTGELDYIYDC